MEVSNNTVSEAPIVWRQGGGMRKPETEGLHVNQNPAHKSGFLCVQGKNLNQNLLITLSKIKRYKKEMIIRPRF